MQQLYWLLFVIAWLGRLLPANRGSRWVFVLAHLALLGISMLVILADTRLPVALALNSTISTSVNSADWKGIDKDLEKFITPQYYLWSTLMENLSF